MADVLFLNAVITFIPIVVGHISYLKFLSYFEGFLMTSSPKMLASAKIMTSWEK